MTPTTTPLIRLRLECWLLHEQVATLHFRQNLQHYLKFMQEQVTTCMYGPATDANLISLPTSSPPPDPHTGLQHGPPHPQIPRSASPKPQPIVSHPYFTHAVSFDSALSSLPGPDSGFRDAHSTASGPEATLYPDTINPAFQPGRVSSGAPLNRSPLSAHPMNSSSEAPPELQSQTLDSAFAATADSSDVGPNRTLDQILASDANPSQSLLPLRQRRDDVRMVRAMVDDTVAATSRNIAPAPPPPVCSSPAAIHLNLGLQHTVL